MRYLLKLSPLLVVLIVPFLAGAAEPTKEDIARLIKQLGSDAFTEREAASKQLAAIGEPVLEQLKKAVDADDIEMRRRVRELIKAIEVPPFVLKRDSAIVAMALSRDGSQLLTVDADIVPRLWDAHTGEPLYWLNNHTETISSAFSPDGLQVLSGGGRYEARDFTVRLWSVESNKDEKQLRGHTAEVTSVAFLPDGKHAVSGSCDKTIRVWDLATAKEVRCFEGHTLSVRSIAVSANGRHLISGGADRTLRLWDIKTGKQLRCFEGHEGAINSVAFAPDGRHVLSGGSDGTVRLWDRKTGKEVRCFTGHTQSIRSVAFSPDGRRAVSGGADATVRMWDVATGKQLRGWTGHKDVVTAVLFTPDGRRVLSSSLDHHVRQWSVPK
ncbi:MAG TPA: WD40 repeat domain-containing protein [Gemmataceae bacterium]|nr:WD40 repeat domain-containing protein [Gemmataceae bacterium]